MVVVDAMLALAAVVVFLASIRLLGDDFDFREDPSVETAYLIAAIVIGLVPLVAAFISGRPRPFLAGMAGTAAAIVAVFLAVRLGDRASEGLAWALFVTALVALPRRPGSGLTPRVVATALFTVFVLLVGTWAAVFLAYPVVAIADQVADRAHAQR